MIYNKIYAVCGRPILHSKSPQIYSLLFDSMNLPACYTRIASDNPREILSMADELNISGLNVTAPFKGDMYELMNESDDDSKAVGAINTIGLHDGKKFGFNTDTFGVVVTLKQNGINLDNKNCLIVGYGNAAKAAVCGITKEWNNANICITGRSKEKTEWLAKRYDCTTLIGNENIKPVLIISTLPKNAFLDINRYLENCDYFMDAAYPDSLMSNEAKKFNCKIISGEEWLFNQALESFRLFTGNEILPSVQNDIKKKLLHRTQYDKKNIYLTGFSGSGKTSIGKLLSEKLGYLYFDTDKLIEERENLSINSIFQKKGEDYFRKVEREVLERVSKINNTVISCGGGTLLKDDSIELVSKNGYIIWLHSKLKFCLGRINKTGKPMLNLKSDLEIEKLYNERKYLYCKSADLIVANSGEQYKPVDSIVYEIKMIKSINNS
ncbi:MAG: shikimate kinase [Bacteroidetes bacterium]|nr:MAG: shikimate kinase [Bacteroidota bacterium]